MPASQFLPVQAEVTQAEPAVVQSSSVPEVAPAGLLSSVATHFRQLISEGPAQAFAG